LLGRVLVMRNTIIPLGSGHRRRFGGPTVRKVELPSGRRMIQEVNADGRNGDRKPGIVVLTPPPERFPLNWSDTGGCPARKGADLGQVGL
jgi:hypothetical protein